MKIKPTDITDFIASKLGFTPSGSISSTNVQDAIHELDSDISSKVSKAGDTMTGALAVPIAYYDEASWTLNQNVPTRAAIAEMTAVRRLHQRNKFVALGGETNTDMGMIGLFDRSVLVHAAYRGTITINITGSGAYTGLGQKSYENILFDSEWGYNTFTGMNATTESIEVIVELPTGVPTLGYNSWAPFIANRFRNSATTITTFLGFKAEVSNDGVDWYAPATGWSTEDISDSPIPGMWLGADGIPPTPVASWRFARFTLTNPRLGTSGLAGTYYITQLGFRHLPGEYAAQYINKAKTDSMYVPLGLASYVRAALPAQKAGAMIYVSDATGGASLAFSDGTNWISVITGSPV